MASATPDLLLLSQFTLVLVLCLPTEGWPGRVELHGWLVTYRDGRPSQHYPDLT